MDNITNKSFQKIVISENTELENNDNKSKFGIYFSKDITDLSSIKYKVIKCFINFCVQELGIINNFNVYLFSSKDENKPQGITLACFMMDNNDIWSRVDGRITMDICRSIAHELEHLRQLQNNEIDMEKYTDIGGHIEDQANAVAGQLCKKFTKKYDCKWVYNI